jgi:hypothetical protein
MKTIYTITVEIQTDLFRTQRTFWFANMEERMRFEQDAADRLGAKRVASNLDHVMTAAEGMRELENEQIRCNEIAAGRYNPAV